MMPIRPDFCLLLGAMLLGSAITLPAPALASDRAAYKTDPVWTGGPLAHLSKYIGTEDNRAVLDDPKVIAGMKRQLRENYGTVRERLLSQPHIIGFYAFSIALGGSLPAQNNQAQAAALVIDLTNSLVFTGLRSGGKTIIYGNRGPDLKNPDYGELPFMLRVWAAQIAHQPLADEPPATNFEWRFE